MKDKLFGGDISPKCEYCELGKASPDGETVLCPKKGIVARDFFCKKYKYDIMKRIPKRAPKLPEFSKDDFEI